MEKQGKWSKFEEDRKELGAELEIDMLSDLLDEVLVDLCGWENQKKKKVL